jgi:hypothetical protein
MWGREICLSVCTVLVASHVFAQDTLTFDNGNILTGRIKRLEQGEVTLDIPFADGDIYADWSRIVLIDSQRVFQFQTSEGQRFLGRILPETDPESGTLVVEYGGITETYQRDDIVLVVETIGQLTGLLEIGVGAGLTLAKANDQRQFNADVNVSYETTAYNISAAINSIFSQQREAEDTNRQSADIRLTKNLGSRWGLTAINTYLRNNEQSLDLRTVVGGGPGDALVQSSQLQLSLFGGLAWNNEQYAPDAEQQTSDSIEALAGFNLSYHRFKQWELDTVYLLYPSLTESGRVRQSFSARLRLRLIRGKPFWWNVSQSLDLDNQPPEGTPGTDYLTTTSLSWTFP